MTTGAASPNVSVLCLARSGSDLVGLHWETSTRRNLLWSCFGFGTTKTYIAVTFRNDYVPSFHLQFFCVSVFALISGVAI